MNKQPEITDKTRQAFVETFCDLYRDRPIERINVKELASKSGYSRATFYNYFRDVYELREYIENDLIRTLQERIAFTYGSDGSMDGFIQVFAELVTEKEEYISVFMSSSNSPLFTERLKQNMLPVLIELFHIQHDDLRARYALEFYINGIVPTLGSWLRNGQEIKVEELAVLIKGILEEGIMAQVKGN